MNCVDTSTCFRMTTSSTTSDLVLNHYSSIAQQDITSNTEHIKNVAESFGYSPEDLVTLPHGANLGLSCGNPLTIAGIKPVSINLGYLDINYLPFSTTSSIVSHGNTSRARLLSILAPALASMSSKPHIKLALQVMPSVSTQVSI